MKKKNKLKIAIVGSGYMAHEYAKVIKKLNNCEINGVFSRRNSRARLFSKKYKIKIVGKSVKDLYFKTKAHAVIVAISPDQIKKISNEIFKFPWVSLIEKPIGINLKEAKSINKLAKKQKRLSYVALNRRQYSSTLKSINLLKRDSSKRIVNIYGQEDLDLIKKYKFSKKITDNYMFVNGIHLIDYMTIFCRGKLKKIDKVFRWKGFKEGFVLSVFYYSSGDIATFSTIWNKPFPWQVIVTTQKQRIELKPLEICKSFSLNKMNKKTHKIDIKDKIFKPGIYKQTLEFIKSIKKRKNSLVKINHGYELMKYLDIIYK
tara:strand:- start:33 stop:983 length:951 start_codon:yes stop_codon:yes gene_type:complete